MVTSIMLASGIIVVAGTWIGDKKLTAKMGLGAAFAGLGLTMLEIADAQLARDIAVLMLLSILFVPQKDGKSYGDAVFKELFK